MTAKPKRRLLPNPPVRTEMALHHPRPRRVVGVMSEDADVERRGGSGGATMMTTTSDTEKELYETAPKGSSSAIDQPECKRFRT